jgi:PleD family two-component response regulator
MKLNMKKIIIAFPLDVASEELKKALEKEDFKVKVVDNGKDVLSDTINDPPDLIIADANLYDISAFEIIKTLKEEGRSKRFPVVVYSQTGSVDHQEKAMELEAKDFISGYIETVEEIVVKIKTHLGEQKVYIINVSKDKDDALSLASDLGYEETECPFCKERLSLHLLRNLSLGRDVFKVSFVCSICNYKTSKKDKEN